MIHCGTGTRWTSVPRILKSMRVVNQGTPASFSSRPMIWGRCINFNLTMLALGSWCRANCYPDSSTDGSSPFYSSTNNNMPWPMDSDLSILWLSVTIRDKKLRRLEWFFFIVSLHEDLVSRKGIRKTSFLDKVVLFLIRTSMYVPKKERKIHVWKCRWSSVPWMFFFGGGITWNMMYIGWSVTCKIILLCFLHGACPGVPRFSFFSADDGPQMFYGKVPCNDMI